MNISDELKKLIQYALTDGVLTEKEKSILLKNAIEEGNDADEFEMYLGALLFEKQKVLKRETLSEMPPHIVVEKSTSNKEGGLKKCPSCGASVKSFQIKCEECGHEFRNNSSMSISKFIEMLNADPVPLQKGIFDSINHQKKLLNYYNKRAEIIKAFPVNNYKEDLLEFLGLAIQNSSNFGVKSILSWLNNPNSTRESIEKDAWNDKAKQIIFKSRVVFQNDKEMIDKIEYYAKQLKIK